MTLRPFSSPAALSLVCCVAVCAAASCGGAPAAPQAPALAGPPAPAAPLAPALDLSAVPEPAGLVVTGRVAKLGASFGVLHGWTSLPMPQSAQVSEIIAGGPIGAVVDVDQPMDMAVAAVGKGMSISGQVAVSAAVRDVDAAKALLAEKFKLVPGDNGVLLLQPVPRQPDGTGDDAKGDDDRHSCEIAPAYGAATTRLVCGLDDGSLAALGPWLTRTAPRTTSDHDAHVELRMAPMRPTIVAQKAMLLALFGALLEGQGGALAAVRDLAVAATTDFAAFVLDVETLAFDLDLSDAGATATTTLAISGTSSTLGHLMVANVDRNGPPPPAFLQMPGDADFGAFGRGIDPSDFAHVRDLVMRAAGDVLAAGGVKDGDRHALVDALGGLASPAPSAYTSGVDAEAVRKALAARRAVGDAADPADLFEARRALSEAVLGWHLMEIDEPAASHVDALKAIVAAWNRPGIQAAVRAKTKGPIPVVRMSPMPPPKAGARGPTLAAGAQHLEIDVPFPVDASEPGVKHKKAPAAAKPLVFHLVVASDGARSWIGAAGDLALAAAKVAEGMSGGSTSLGSRPELASFRDATVGAAGFITGRAFSELAAEAAIVVGEDGWEPELFDSITQLPHQGVTPVEFASTPRAGQPPALVSTFKVSKATIEDGVMTVLRHGGF